jgi:hypothetical protein
MTHIPTPPELQPISAHIFPKESLNKSIIALSDYTSQGCSIHLDDHSINIAKDGNILASGSKKSSDRIWHLDHMQLPSTKNSINAVIHNQHDAEYVQWVFAIFGSPPISTFVTAIRRGYLKDYPRLTTKLVTDNPPVTIATARGHLDLTRQGLHSTKQKESTPSNPTN